MYMDIDDKVLLIELVKKRPLLYNNRVKGYCSKVSCENLWQEIAVELKREVAQCRVVWFRLRSGYSRHLMNMDNYKNGIDNKKKGNWYLAEKMSFMEPYMRQVLSRRTRNVLTKKEENNASSDGGDENSLIHPFDCKIENSLDGDTISITTHDSGPSETQTTANNPVTVNVPEDFKFMKKCRVKISVSDQNIMTFQRIGREIKNPIMPNFKQLELSRAYSSLPVEISPAPSKLAVLQEKDEASQYQLDKQRSSNPSTSKEINILSVESNFIEPSDELSLEKMLKEKINASRNEKDTQFSNFSKFNKIIDFPRIESNFTKSTTELSLAGSKGKVAASGNERDQQLLNISIFNEGVDIPRVEYSLAKPSAESKVPASRNERNKDVSNMFISKRTSEKFAVRDNKIPNIQISKGNEIPRVDSSSFTKTPTDSSEPAVKEKDAALLFFKSILPDLKKLSARRLRLFKQDILLDLNKYLDYEENA